MSNRECVEYTSKFHRIFKSHDGVVPGIPFKKRDIRRLLTSTPPLGIPRMHLEGFKQYVTRSVPLGLRMPVLCYLKLALFFRCYLQFDFAHPRPGMWLFTPPPCIWSFVSPEEPHMCLNTRAGQKESKSKTMRSLPLLSLDWLGCQECNAPNPPNIKPSNH